MEQLQTVPFGSVAGMLFSMLISFLVPLGLAAALWRKEKASWFSYPGGMTVFILFAMFLGSMAHAVILTATGSLITGNLLLYALYGGLMAAAFEECGRLVAMRFVLRRHQTKQNALMYGVGHGGTEAMLILGLTSLNNFINSTMINSGTMEGTLASLDDATRQMVSQSFIALWETPSYLFFVAGYERLVTMALHIALSVLVYRAVKDKTARWFWAAFGAHFAVDFVAVLLSGVSVLLTEAVFTVITAGVVWYAAKAYREAAE